MANDGLSEIQSRLANWPRGYWLAGEKNASLIQNDDERHQIAAVSAEHAATIDLLAHAYTDLQALLAEVERLRSREAQHEHVIAKLEARYEQQGVYNHQLVRRLVAALEIARAVAEAPIEVAKFGTVNKTQMRVLCLRSDVRHVQEQARALLAAEPTAAE